MLYLINNQLVRLLRIENSIIGFTACRVCDWQTNANPRWVFSHDLGEQVATVTDVGNELFGYNPNL